MGAKPRGDARRALGNERSRVALARFFHALGEQKIPFLVIGMAAAVLQGVPVVTDDVDVWIGLPQREHDRVLLICHEQDAKILADHIVELEDGALLNFTYETPALSAFGVELKRAKKINWLGLKVAVLSLEQIHRSKSAIGRPKDKVHLFYLEQAMKLQKKSKQHRRV